MSRLPSTDRPDPSWDEAARRLERALARQPLPELPADFAERTTQLVLSDAVVEPTPTMARRVLPWVAVAACLALVAVFARPWSLDGPLGRVVARKPAPPVAPPAPAPRPLRNSLDEASSAVASLTRRTAAEAAEPTKLLMPQKVDPPEVPNVPVEPTAQALEEVRHGVSEGFEPVTTSAKRAFSMFLREFTPPEPRKPDL